MVVCHHLQKHTRKWHLHHPWSKLHSNNVFDQIVGFTGTARHLKTYGSIGDHPSKQGGRKRETNSISKHGPTPRWLPLELNLYLISWWLMYHDSNHRIQLIDLFIGDKLCSKNISCNLSHLCVYYCSGTILYIYIYIDTYTNQPLFHFVERKKHRKKSLSLSVFLPTKIWVWTPTEAVHQSWAAHNEIVGCQSNLLWVPP